MANEQGFWGLIKERLSVKTTISISHRLEAAVEHDQVLVMGDGKVIHFGSPAEAVPGFRASFVFEALVRNLSYL